jgi:rhodanese-related sulfurtransferase
MRLLRGAAFVLAGLSILPDSPAAQTTVRPSDLLALLRKNPVILDTRVPNERLDADGRYIGLKCARCPTVVGWYDPQMHLPEGVVKTLSRYKNRAILAVCKRGIRSSGAATYLATIGFRNIYTLKGGLRRVPSNLLEVNSGTPRNR